MALVEHEDDLDDVVDDLVAAVQQGDFRTIQNAFSRPFRPPLQVTPQSANAKNPHVTIYGSQLHQLPVAVVDKDGCTLLQWAAINNRCQIASFLLRVERHGQTPTVGGFADKLPLVNIAGGILRETPLQWALRRKYYIMMELLVQSGADLSHKSIQGTDALSIAIRSGDLLGTYLLLQWGASPNSTDSDGLTPLLWLLKNRASQPLTLDLIRLLLQFEADVCLQDPADGSSALHLLARLNLTSIDMSAAIAIHKVGGMLVSTVKNHDNLTPYSVAVHHNNRRLVRFFFDMIVYHFTTSSSSIGTIAPTFINFSIRSFNFSTTITFCAVISACALTAYYGLIYGMCYYTVLYLLVWQNLIPWTIITTRGHLIFGVTLAGVFTEICGILFYITPHLRFSAVSSHEALVQSVPGVLPSAADTTAAAAATAVATTTAVSVWASCTFLFVLVLSLYLFVKFHTTPPQTLPVISRPELTAQVLQSAIPEGPLLTPSAATTTASESLIDNHHPYVKKVRLCTLCLVNKRHATTHCKYCNMCIVGYDYHHPMFNNCIGQKNRHLLFYLLLAVTALHAWLFLWYWTLGRQHFCPQANGMLWRVFAVQGCLFGRVPMVFVLQWMAVMITLQAMGELRLQTVLLIRETTLFNVVHGRYNRHVSVRKAYAIMARFLWTGAFNITYQPAASTSSSTTDGCKDKSCRHCDDDSQQQLLQSSYEADSQGRWSVEAGLLENGQVVPQASVQVDRNSGGSGPVIDDDVDDFISDEEDEYEVKSHGHDHGHDHSHGHDHHHGEDRGSQDDLQLIGRHTTTMSIRADDRS